MSGFTWGSRTGDGCWGVGLLARITLLWSDEEDEPGLALPAPGAAVGFESGFWVCAGSCVVPLSERLTLLLLGEAVRPGFSFVLSVLDFDDTPAANTVPAARRASTHINLILPFTITPFGSLVRHSSEARLLGC